MKETEEGSLKSKDQERARFEGQDRCRKQNRTNGTQKIIHGFQENKGRNTKEKQGRKTRLEKSVFCTIVSTNLRNTAECWTRSECLVYVPLYSHEIYATFVLLIPVLQQTEQNLHKNCIIYSRSYSNYTSGDKGWSCIKMCSRDKY